MLQWLPALFSICAERCAATTPVRVGVRIAKNSQRCLGGYSKFVLTKTHQPPRLSRSFRSFAHTRTKTLSFDNRVLFQKQPKTKAMNQDLLPTFRRARARKTTREPVGTLCCELTIQQTKQRVVEQPLFVATLGLTYLHAPLEFQSQTRYRKRPGRLPGVCVLIGSSGAANRSHGSACVLRVLYPDCTKSWQAQ